MPITWNPQFYTIMYNHGQLGTVEMETGNGKTENGNRQNVMQMNARKNL